MITWSDDVNLDKICVDINKYISSYKMKSYFIYGLQGQERPHVRVAPAVTPVLVDLFKQSKYLLETKEVAERYCADCDTKHWHGECCCDTDLGCELCHENNITIGIRRDIRGNVPVARKLIKTIIFGLEDKLVIAPSSKLNLGRRVRKKMILPRKKVVKGEHSVLGPCGCGTPEQCPNGNLDLSANAIGHLPPSTQEEVTQLAAELAELGSLSGGSVPEPSRMNRIITQIQSIVTGAR
jgi:hypothetical protein